MRHTLKAIFDKRSDAQHVLDQLLASGFKHADTTSADARHDEGFAASVRHTFNRMFGAKHQEDLAPPPDDATGAAAGTDATQAQHVVVITTESAPEAERAADIIEQHGPSEVEEQHEHMDGDAAGAYRPGVAAMRTVYPPGTAPGSLQFRAPEDSHYFGTQNPESPPIGNTFQETMGTTAPWGNPEEDTGDAAAYRYGEEMRASEPSSTRSWEEAEPSLQSGWENRDTHGEPEAWHRIKEAVRRGWDRMRH